MSKIIGALAPTNDDIDASQPDDAITGRLLWVPPHGPPREILPDSIHTGLTTSCPNESCEEPLIGTIPIREHDSCGFVSVTGFLSVDGTYECPKCDALSSENARVTHVGNIRSCLTCGSLAEMDASTVRNE